MMRPKLVWNGQMGGTVIRATMVGLLALLCLATLGCAAAREEPSAANAPTANVVGTWTGWAGTGMRSAPVTLTMQQNGTAVTGNLSVGGRPDLSGEVTGSLRGNLLKLSLPTTTLGELQVSQDTITGVPVAGLPVTLQRAK
jgi:carbohydrate-selective porin OprB